MDTFHRQSESPEADEAPIEPFTNIERLIKIAENLDIDTEFTPQYLEHTKLASRFAFLGKRISEYIPLPTTKHDPGLDVFNLPEVLVCQIKTKEGKTENIRLGIVFGLERGWVEYIDVLWFADAVNQYGLDDNSFDSSHALDPLRITRSDYLAPKKKPRSDRDQLKRNLNYTAQALEVYGHALSAENDANGPESQRIPRPIKDMDPIDDPMDHIDPIDKAVKNLLARLIDID